MSTFTELTEAKQSMARSLGIVDRLRNLRLNSDPIYLRSNSVDGVQVPTEIAEFVIAMLDNYYRKDLHKKCAEVKRVAAELEVPDEDH
jgi:hypothetical protein